MSDFPLCFVYAAAWWEKMQVSVNALTEGSFMFLQGCYLYWALIPGRAARIIS